MYEDALLGTLPPDVEGTGRQSDPAQVSNRAGLTGLDWKALTSKLRPADAQLPYTLPVAE